MLSSDTLFHFTDSAEKFIGILRNEFYPRHSLEKIEIEEPPIEVAFPMVCFCDIPLSQIKNHIETYGYYGIGMSKEWGSRKGLNPVLYLRPETALTKRIVSILETVQTKIPQEDDLSADLKSKLIDFLRYIKPYEGDLVRKDKIVSNVRFYDEREWRYIPSIDEMNNRFGLSKDQYFHFA